MKDSGIYVDFEWAYKQVMANENVKGKSAEWVKTYLEGWRKSYLDGFLNGYSESNIVSVSKMKRYGFSSADIADITGMSLMAINLIMAEEEK